MVNWFLAWIPKQFNGGRISSSGAGTTGYPHIKEWNWIPTHTIYKNELKMNQRPKYKS